MRQTLLLIAAFEALDVLASNATTAAAAAASGNATAATTAAAAASGGNGTAATTAAAAPAATTAAAAKPAATTAAAAKPAATTAAAAKPKAEATKAPVGGNTTAADTKDAAKIKFEVPAVKVTVDFTKLTTAALKTSAAKAIFDGVKKESCVTVAKFASVAECDAGKAGKSGKLFAKFDSEFGTLTDATMTAGYDAARRLASHAKETTNDFKFVLSVPAASAATEKTAMNTELAKASAFSESSLSTAIAAAWTAAAVPGNATVKFTKPTMTAADAAATTTTTTSGAAQVTGLFALALAGAASLF